ncbi:hypothetical protein D3C81_1182710 [compost metagenome]
MRLLKKIEKLFTFQLLHRRIQQPRNRRIGEADQTILAHHQYPLGCVIQHRSIEGARHFQVMTQALQRAAITLVFQQRLHLRLEDLRVERLEQVIHRTTGVALEHGGIGLLVCGKKDDRGQPGAVAATHQPGNLETVHFGHLHVEQHKVDFVLQQGAQGFRP